MSDVAKLAGVAPITVSRALREPTKVAEQTRQRIDAAIRQVNYVPDLVASSLASQHSRAVAVIVPTLADSIFNDTVQGLSDRLRDHGYQLIIGNSSYEAGEEEDVAAAILGRRPDGLILTGTSHTDRTRELISGAGIPVVETWELNRRPLDCQVGFSNWAAGRAMTDALANAGYRRIAFLGSADRRSTQRRDGYRAALRQHDLGPVRTECPAHPPTVRAGAEAFVRLLDRFPDTDAVFCANDVFAIGALFECQRQGWQVPERVAIAGFGDFDFAAETVPALTTVRVPRYDIGAEAATVLLRRLCAEIGPGAQLDLGFEIIRRDTA